MWGTVYGHLAGHNKYLSSLLDTSHSNLALVQFPGGSLVVVYWGSHFTDAKQC